MRIKKKEDVLIYIPKESENINPHENVGLWDLFLTPILILDTGNLFNMMGENVLLSFQLFISECGISLCLLVLCNYSYMNCLLVSFPNF